MRFVRLAVGMMLAPALARADAPMHASDASPPAFKPVRYLEEHAGPVSFGGQHRLRYESEDARSVMLVRSLVHAAIRFFPELTVFGQAGAFQALGIPASDAQPPDVDHADVTQLFVESRASFHGVSLITRVGRQEMPLGSTRWVSTRDGTNVRQSFDLVRATIAGERWNIESFVGVLPRLSKGVLDDIPDREQRFWGTYATFQLRPGFGLELAYLGRARPDATYADVSGRETRQTFATRLHVETSFGLELVQHALVQVGAARDADILAWGLASAAWQRLPGSFRGIRVGVRGDALSGDPRAADRRLGTFHPLFPNQTFYSALPAIYPSNVYDVHPLARFETKSIAVEVGCAFFWRQSTADAIYTPPGQALPVRGNERYIGAQPSLSFAYRANRHLAFNAEYARVVAGPAFRGAGEDDIEFFGTWTTYTY